MQGARPFFTMQKLAALTLALVAAPTLAAGGAAGVPAIPFTKYRLENGLEVILAPDKRLQIVAVNFWYHVGPFHPGLGRFVTCDDLRWEFADWASLQVVGVNNGLAKPGTKTYERWHKAVLDFYRGETPPQGAIWLTYYPNVMIEWYPHVLVVSTLYPKGPQKTLNVVEFYYPEDIQAFEREFVEAEQAAYWETCTEDDEIALRMDAGRRALMERGDDEIGPYQSPMEDGMQQFHEWYRRAMGSQL